MKRSESQHVTGHDSKLNAKHEHKLKLVIESILKDEPQVVQKVI